MFGFGNKKLRDSLQQSNDAYSCLFKKFCEISSDLKNAKEELAQSYRAALDSSKEADTYKADNVALMGRVSALAAALEKSTAELNQVNSLVQRLAQAVEDAKAKKFAEENAKIAAKAKKKTKPKKKK